MACFVEVWSGRYGMAGSYLACYGGLGYGGLRHVMLWQAGLVPFWLSRIWRVLAGMVGRGKLRLVRVCHVLAGKAS